jgi:hypothetical protein
MSVTTSPAAPTPALPPEKFWTPQLVIAIMGMCIVAGTVAATLTFGDTGTKQLTTGIVLGTFGASIFSFYFGSSKSGQAKDNALIAQLSGPTQLPSTTATTTVPGSTTTIQTPKEPGP